MATSPFNDRRNSAPEQRILTSLWTGLHPALIARFFPVTKMPDGSGWSQSVGDKKISDDYTVSNDVEVHCPISDGTSESSFGWSSPFEGSGDSQAPMLSALLQSGSITPALIAAGKAFNVDLSGSSAVDVLNELQGRSSMTRLNSTQVYVGNAPLKMSMTCHFRALRDPISEVRNCIQQLKEWAHPQMLAEDGFLGNAIKNAGKQSLLQTIFPSVIPQIIGMRYGDSTFMPLVIESISEPFTNPRNEAGVMISSSVQITLATLTSLDRRDISKVYSR